MGRALNGHLRILHPYTHRDEGEEAGEREAQRERLRDCIRTLGWPRPGRRQRQPKNVDGAEDGNRLEAAKIDVGNIGTQHRREVHDRSKEGNELGRQIGCEAESLEVADERGGETVEGKALAQLGHQDEDHVVRVAWRRRHVFPQVDVGGRGAPCRQQEWTGWSPLLATRVDRRQGLADVHAQHVQYRQRKY